MSIDAPPQTRRRRIGPRQAEAMMDGPIDPAWYPVLRAHFRAYGPLAKAGIPRRVARVWCDRLWEAGFLEAAPEDFTLALPAIERPWMEGSTPTTEESIEDAEAATQFAARPA